MKSEYTNLLSFLARNNKTDNTSSWEMHKWAAPIRIMLVVDRVLSVLLDLRLIAILSIIYFLINPKLETLIVPLLISGFLHHRDACKRIENKFKEHEDLNNKRYFDQKNTFQIILNNMVYEKNSWYNSGSWSSDRIKAELKIDEMEKLLKFKLRRDLSKIEIHLWMLYIRSNNYVFRDILFHLMQGEKVHLSFIDNNGFYAISMNPINKNCGHDYCCYCFKTDSAILVEPGRYGKGDGHSPLGGIKEYSVNDDKWLYWGGLIKETMNAIRFCCRTKAVDMDKRAADHFGGFDPTNLVYEICDGECHELMQETEALRSDIDDFFKQSNNSKSVAA